MRREEWNRSEQRQQRIQFSVFSIFFVSSVNSCSNWTDTRVPVTPHDSNTGPQINSASSQKNDRGYMVPYRTTIPGTDVSFEMVPVPGGAIRLRSQEEPIKPARATEFEVTVEPSWLGRYEVTWAQYNQ